MSRHDPWRGRGWRYRLALIAWGVVHLCRVHLRDTLLDLIHAAGQRARAPFRALARWVRRRDQGAERDVHAATSPGRTHAR